MNNPGTVISLQNVTVNFGGVDALINVNLDIPENMCTGIVGPSASGKTTLVKTIAGLVKPVPGSGSVFIEGINVTGLDEINLQKMRAKIGMLFQNNALFDYLTVGENVAFPLRRLFSLSENEIKMRVNERLERVGLPGMENRYPSTLSGGQKKRVGVARCTIARQPYLIYDDPTAGLDPVTASKIFLLLREEQIQNKTTTIVISSDVDSLVKFIDNIVIMKKGMVVFSGKVEDAYHCDDPWVRAFIRGDWKRA